jgi:hypothetical protein
MQPFGRMNGRSGSFMFNAGKEEGSSRTSEMRVEISQKSEAA